MISKLLYFCIYVTLLLINNIDGSYSTCGDWQAYGDEKCIKIFNTKDLVTYDEASKSCSQMDKTSLVLTIHSQKEQDFLNEYLFKTNKLVENIWIGLKNNSDGFKWTDSSNNVYTNWKKDYPTIKPDYSCVQLDPESLQWINEPCIRRALVVCEKMPEITDFLKQILQIKEEIKEQTAKVEISTEKVKKSEEDLKKLKEDLTANNNSLTESKNKLSETSNKMLKFVYSNKSVSHSEMFTDINGNMIALIIPLDGMKEKTFEDSVNLCKNFDSTLIEIESSEKQAILEKFLGSRKNELKLKGFNRFWVNGLRDSSGSWKWSKSNKPFIHTNWETNNPIADPRHNNICVDVYDDNIFAKWVNVPKTDAHFVMCEHSFEI